MNWRSYGRIPESIFRAELAAVGSPMAREVEPILQAAGEHSALMTAMCKEESQLATAFNLNVPTNRNPLNLKQRGGGEAFLKFASYTDCIKEWVSRITDPLYAYADTVTVLDLVNVYAPKSDSNNPEAYAANVLARFDRWGIVPKETPVSNLIIGQSDRPAITDDLVIKPEGMGWGDYGPRTLRAVVLHRVVGAARYTSGHFRNLADEHGRNALTDWGVCGALDGDMDGVILKWNDPDSRRSPWASGPLFSASGQLLANGDAVGFYRRYVVGDPAGANVINRDTEAVELSGYYDTPITQKQLGSVVALIAYRVDVKMKLPWTSWPKNHEGEQAILWHGEVNGWSKPCPGDEVRARTQQIIDLVGERLKAIQERADAPTIPMPTPIEPVIGPYRPSHARLAEWFGEAVVDGKRIAYNQRGPISAIWRRRGRETGQYPAVDPRGSHVLDDGTVIVRFTDGWVVVDQKGPAPAAALGKAA